MTEVPIGLLAGALVVLVLLSAGFSGSETGLMTLNRYRLRHLAKSGHRGARIVQRLLARPDRLIGLILLGNNFVNIAASSVATLIALRLGGEAYIAAATFLLTFVILIFGEVAPKTVAALYPERFAFPAAYVLAALMRPLYPLVVAVNGLANGLLRLLGVPLKTGTHSISRDELRTIVNEAGAMIPRRHQKMLVSILDLDQATVEDIMVPRTEIVGIDLDDPVEEIVEQLANTQYTRLPVYHGSIEQVQGVVHVRRLLPLITSGRFTKEELVARLREPYFIPEGTPLHRQLINFQNARRRLGRGLRKHRLHHEARAEDKAVEPVEIGLHVLDRPGRHTRIHGGLRHRRGNAKDQPLIEGRRDEVVGPEHGRLVRQGAGGDVRRLFPGEVGDGAHRRELHFLIDGGRADV